MRDFLSRNGRLHSWLFGASVFFFLSLWGSGWNISEALNILWAALFCLGIPIAMFFLMGCVVGQLVKTVVNVGNSAASNIRRRKGYAEHEWASTADILNYDSRYIIGDDGELVELPDMEEKSMHDTSTL